MNLCEWLESVVNCINVAPVTVTVKALTLEGARYIQPGIDGRERLYLLGDVKRLWRIAKRKQAVIWREVIEDRGVKWHNNWYIAGYYREEDDSHPEIGRERYHPFGDSTLLFQWEHDLDRSYFFVGYDGRELQGRIIPITVNRTSVPLDTVKGVE